MRKFLSILLTLSLLVSLTACSGPEPGKVLDSFFQHLQKGEYEKAQELTAETSAVQVEEVFATLFPSDFLTPSDKAFLAPLEQFTYTTEEPTLQGEDKATITVTLEIINFTEILDSLYKDAMEQASTGIYMDEDEILGIMEKGLNEYLTKPERETTPTTLSVSLVKEGKKWKVDFTPELANALTGNAMPAFGSLLAS